MFHAASKVMKMAIIIFFCFFTVTNPAMVKMNECFCLHFQAALAQRLVPSHVPCCIAFVIKEYLYHALLFHLAQCPTLQCKWQKRNVCFCLHFEAAFGPDVGFLAKFQAVSLLVSGRHKSRGILTSLLDPEVFWSKNIVFLRLHCTMRILSSPNSSGLFVLGHILKNP